MDLPLRHPTDSSYQIHRTPYFRRMHRKDSDQLVRLKQACENVHSFNEKPIQAQIKNLRLGKLLRRIRQSLTSSKSIRADKDHQSPPNTAEKTRADELAKARQLGIEYCRQNLDIPPPILNFLENQKHRRIQKQLREKSRLDRRLHYGNSESQKNRKSQPYQSKIRRSHILNEQGYVEKRNASVHTNYLLLGSFSITEEGLRSLQRSKSKEDFINFLAHCLSTDKPNPNILKTFKRILQSKNDLYSDLQSAINQRLLFIERYKSFIENLSNLAASTVPKETLVIDGSFESFNSTTNIMPRSKSAEVYIRTYRYSEEDEFLPPPSESLLKIPDYIDAEEISENVPAPPPFPKPRSSHFLSTKPENNFQTDAAIKMSLTQKFGDIIRDTVRQESAVILTDLAKAIKH